MEGLTDQHERIRQTDDGRVILFVHLAGFFPVSSPFSDTLLEVITLGYFVGAPSEELHYNPCSSPAFDIPKSRSIIPNFKNFKSPAVARLPDLIGTIPAPSPFPSPYRGTL